jgi:protein phosphatase
MKIIERLMLLLRYGTCELAFGVSDAGRNREINEDSFCLLPDFDIYVVADGMGGHRAGEVASSQAVRIIKEHFTPSCVAEMKKESDKIQGELVAAVGKAHEGILNLSKTAEKYADMGSTVVLALLADGMLHTCHVGDSRAYVSSSPGLSQITQDHSDVGELVRAGKMTSEEARHSPLKNRITQALGAPFQPYPEYIQRPLGGGDLVLLCSDGLWDMLSDAEIQDTLRKGGSLRKLCQRLIDRANDAGGDDNITVVIVRNP